MKIAFLGLGHMGSELVAHLIPAHEVTVWNRTSASADAVGKLGASIADTAIDAVGDADIIVSVLFGPDAVRDVITTRALPIKPQTLWIDVTTVAPADAAEFAAFASSARIDYVHSPVIGSVMPARAGKLGVLVGGNADAVRRATEIVSLWADPEKLHSYDSAEKAALGKLIANLSLATATQGVVETLRLGHSGRFTTDEVLNLLTITPLAAMAALKTDAIRNATFDQAQFSVKALAKDAGLMLKTSDYPLPSLTALDESLQTAIRSGKGDWDFSAVLEWDSK
jgi:3-hydroxyisobutyrate dehydrogenase